MVERINRAVSDCLVLCAYSTKAPLDAARDYIDALRRDATWDNANVDSVESLVMGVLTRLQRDGASREGWVK
ncbi:MAG TPA: hypothetical protein VMP01_11225 [Pirellulaceae bacterium]|nr:hypothetical protein [Pirellulaceae bacterium]